MEEELIKFYGEGASAEDLRLSRKLTRQQFSMKDLDVKYQYVNHWRNEGLLFTNESSRGAKPFSYVDYLWVKMIEKMKVLGMHFSIIRKAKEQMLKPPLWSHGIDDVIDNLIKESPHKREYYEKRRKEAFKQASRMTFFSRLVIDHILQKKHLSFWINAEGEVNFISDKRIGRLKRGGNLTRFYHHAFVSISLTEIVQETIHRKDLDLVAGDLEVINVEEKRVLDLIAGKRLVELNIHGEGGAVIDLVAEFKDHPEELKPKFINLITSGAYEKISYATVTGTEVKFGKQRPKKEQND